MLTKWLYADNCVEIERKVNEFNSDDNNCVRFTQTSMCSDSINNHFLAVIFYDKR
jgi:hypothetical protein